MEGLLSKGPTPSSSTPQCLQNMLFIAFGGAWPLAGLEHVFSRMFNEMVMENEDSCMQTSADQGAALEEKPEVWDIPKQS